MRRMLMLLAAMVAILLLTTPLVTTKSAYASTITLSRPSARVVYGDRTLTLAWQPISNATSYRIRYATNSHFSAAHAVIFHSTTGKVTGLTNGRKYYVRVEAVRPGSKTSISATYNATPRSGYPGVLPIVKATPGTTPDTIQVSWTPLQQATEVIVYAGSTNYEDNRFQSAWLPATATSVTLTVPPSLRWIMGTGTGNPIYVKVGEFNNSHNPSIIPETYSSDPKVEYRRSVFGTYTFATPIAVTGQRQLTIASYNVQTPAAAPPGHPWSDRRTRVAADIAYSNADLVGTQEATTSAVSGYQYQDIANLLAEPQYGGYEMSGSLPAHYDQTNATVESWFYYKPSVLTRLDGGIISPYYDLNIGWPADLEDRRGTWAEFQVNATGAKFYAVDIHLPVDDGASNTSYKWLRIREAAALSSFILAKAGNTPAVILGDLNSEVYAEGYGAQSKLHDLGWYDTANTMNRTNRDLQTCNWPDSYPAVPVRAPNVNTGRIDYIFTKNMGGALKYVNQVLFNPDGTLNINYQGSDHNLQMVTLSF